MLDIYSKMSSVGAVIPIGGLPLSEASVRVITGASSWLPLPATEESGSQSFPSFLISVTL